MPRTLSGKLIAILVISLTVVSAIYVGLTIMATRLHTQGINQNLNRSLAATIVGTTPLIREKRVDPHMLDQVFAMLMEINPAIEVYLLDPTGAILDYSAPPEKVLRRQVSLAPIDALLSESEDLPIRGDDPRDPHGQKIFSAAPILDDGELQGYLYVVLGGEAYDTVVEVFERSYILHLTLGAVAISVVLIALAGAFSFHALTRRLRLLTSFIEAFRQSSFQRSVDIPETHFRPAGDEIDRLGRLFDEMAGRIVDQIAALETADSARSELFANISHDLRTPLAALQGAIETLSMKQAALDPEEQRAYLDLALRHSEQLGRLIGQLFELATLESSDRQLRSEPFSVAELVQDIAQKFRPSADGKGLTIVCDPPIDLPFIEADIALIERVLENLVENAIKNTPEGGVIELSLSLNDGSISVAVSDTGCGMPVEELPRIFDRTYRTEKNRDPGSPGTGLGLAIAKQILEMHGSCFEVESTVGEGSTFRFRLPTGDKQARA